MQCSACLTVAFTVPDRKFTFRPEEATNTSNPLPSQPFKSLMHRVTNAGFSKEFVGRAILPDWWDDRCSEDPGLLQDVEIRIARFLGRSVAVIADPSVPLDPPSYPAAQLRRVRDINRDRLGPAIHTAIRIAAAVVRSLRDTAPRTAAMPSLPADGLAWRGQIRRNSVALTLTDVATDLWERGIPVVPLDILPAPYFQGMACIVEDHPAILLGYKHDEPGRVAFLIAHEAGHIAAGDCAPEQPVVDEEEEITDGTDIERRADLYATQVLVGETNVPQLENIDARDFKKLARQASAIERTTGADASSMIFAWARRTGDYATATMAVQALYRSAGARKTLRRLFASHVDLAGAAETDRDLLRCVLGEPMPNEAAR